MLSELENNFSVLEKKILNLYKKFKNLSDKHAETSEELQKVREEYVEEKRRNQILAEENKELKLYSAISGNAEHNRLMKNHINRLVKEIDMCVSELQNTGL
jgi:chromosome segregation ATPase